MVIFVLENLSMHELTEQELIRREKLVKLKGLGIDPYPAATFDTTHYAADITNIYKEDLYVTLAGRLMSRRVQGKASFAELQDASGRVQLYFNRDILCPDEDKTLYNDIYKKLLDIGDIIGVEGKLFTTKVGEKTIEVQKLFLLSKSLRPLPLPKADSDGNTYDAFTDPDL